MTMYPGSGELTYKKSVICPNSTVVSRIARGVLTRVGPRFLLPFDTSFREFGIFIFCYELS